VVVSFRAVSCWVSLILMGILCFSLVCSLTYFYLLYAVCFTLFIFCDYGFVIYFVEFCWVWLCPD
jgi:hypothetical protein